MAQGAAIVYLFWAKGVFGVFNAFYDFSVKSVLLSTVFPDGIVGVMNCPWTWALLAWVLSRFLVTFRVVAIESDAPASVPPQRYHLIRIAP